VLGTLLANERHWLELSHPQYSKRRTTPPLNQRTELCDLMLLQGLPALESSVAGSSAAMGMTKSLRDSDHGSIKGKAGRGLLMGVDNPTIRQKN
jgi:hypothetical protein